MSAQEQISELSQTLSTASAAIDNVGGAIQEIVDNPFIAAADPMLLEAQQEAVKALHHAEAAIAHLERLNERIAEDLATKARRALLVAA